MDCGALLLRVGALNTVKKGEKKGKLKLWRTATMDNQESLERREGSTHNNEAAFEDEPGLRGGG